MSMTPLQQRRETVLDLYASGLMPAQIAVQTGYEAPTIRSIIGHARTADDARTRNRRRAEAFAWTVELVVEAIRLKNEGKSARQIGDAIGASKNSVIGKLFRIGEKIGKKPAQPPKPRAPRPRKVARLPQKAKEAHRRVPAPVARPAPTLRLVSVGKPIWALSADECRWPVSPDNAELHLFCASPTARGDSYCAHCSPLAYSPTKPPAGRRFG